MNDDERFDPFAVWVYEHPWTICYIAVVVTALLVLQVVQVVSGQ